MKTKPKPTENPQYTLLLRNIIKKARADGTTRTKDLIQVPKIQETQSLRKKEAEQERKDIRLKKDALIHSETTRINRQIANIGFLLERPIKKGKDACVRVNWFGWASRVADNIELTGAEKRLTPEKKKQVAELKNIWAIKQVSEEGLEEFGALLQTYVLNLLKHEKDVSKYTIEGIEKNFVRFIGIAFQNKMDRVFEKCTEASLMYRNACSIEVFKELDAAPYDFLKQGIAYHGDTSYYLK